jgi:MFS transporter, ACS family, D-galactonate transporter
MNWQRTISSSRYAWAVVAMLWPVAVLNYLDRQMLSTMGLSIKVDILELQSAQNFGRLMAIFLWIYAFCSPIGGALADRINRKWLIVASLAVWSSVTLLMGKATSFDQLYILRGIMGVSEALYMPAGLALIADYHRGPTRSLAVGSHLSGVYMGQALGGIGGWVAQEVSWRAAFVGCGAIGVAYSLVLICFLRETNRTPAENTSAHPTAREIAEAGVNWRGFVILVLCFSLPSLSGWAVKNWLPTLLQDRFQMAQAPSGLWATITAASAGFIGVIVGGWLADRWSRRAVRGRTYVSALGLALLVPTIVLVGLAPGFPLTIVGAALYGLGFGIFDANNMPILCQLAPGRFRATGYGLMNLCGIASGAYLTPLLGKLKDSGVPLATGFAYCSIPALLAAVLMFLLRPTNRDRGVASAN